MILKRLLLITTLIILVTGITVPSIDVSADKKSDNDKKKQAKAWLKEKFGKYKEEKKDDYKKEQNENKKYAKEKREQDRKDAKEKREEYRKDAKEKRDDYKKEKEKDDDYDDDYELGEKFNCKFTGGYYSPEDLPSGQSIVSIGIGECNTVSNPAISYGRLIVSDTLNDNDCYDVVSKGMKIFNGFTSQSTTIYIEITAEQCFQNGNGDKVTPTGICGLSRSYYLLTSTVDGKFTITNGATGSGTFTTTVTNWVDRSGISYCDSEYPLGSLFQSKFDGSIILN
jgi:hypothetical protein